MAEIKAKLPELPEDRRDRFMREYGLPRDDAELLTSSRNDADYEEEFIEIFGKTGEGTRLSPLERAKLGSNWILGEVRRITNANNIGITDFKQRVSPERLVNLTGLMVKGSITGTIAKPVLEEMFKTGKSAEEIIKERGLSQISDTGELEAAIVDVINSNAQAVSDYKAGKETALKFLVGQVMRATKGRANPVMAGDMLQKKLEEG